MQTVSRYNFQQLDVIHFSFSMFNTLKNRKPFQIKIKVPPNTDAKIIWIQAQAQAQIQKMFRVCLLCYYVLTNTQLKTVQRQNIWCFPNSGNSLIFVIIWLLWIWCQFGIGATKHCESCVMLQKHLFESTEKQNAWAFTHLYNLHHIVKPCC